MTNARTAARTLLEVIRLLSDAEIDRLDTDFIDYNPEAPAVIDLFNAVNPSINFFYSIADFSHALMSVTPEDDRDRVERFLQRLFRALLRFEMNENIPAPVAS